MSLLDPLSCGFAKVSVFQVLTEEHGLEQQSDEAMKQFRGRILRAQYKKLTDLFGNLYFNIDYTTFRNKYPRIITQMRNIGKTNKKWKNELIATFGKEKWKELPESKRGNHSIENCNGCTNSYIYKNCLSKFPTKCNRYKLKAKRAGLYNRNKLVDITNKTSPKQNHQNAADRITLAKSIVKSIEKQMGETAVERLHFFI